MPPIKLMGGIASTKSAKTLKLVLDHAQMLAYFVTHKYAGNIDCLVGFLACTSLSG